MSEERSDRVDRLVRFLSKSYKVSFSRYGVFVCYGPRMFFMEAHFAAWIYRAKEGGRDATVIDY